jgi:hypothetical protein
MNENSLPAKSPDSDLSEKDLAKVHEFNATGRTGLMKLSESDFYRMSEMYMNGSTYWQIANTLAVSRPLVMYLSQTYGWYPAKQEYLQELQEKIKARVIDSKLASQDFILLLIQAYQKKIGKKLQKYLATDDPAHADEINLKEIDKLLKAVEMIQDMNSDGKTSKGKTPAVGLNLGDGVTIERSGDNKVTITPAKDKALDNMLKKYADQRRAEQNKKPEKSSDINDEQPKNEESDNEK